MKANFLKGDIIFVYLKDSTETESIARLCLGWNDEKINHVGIYIGNDTVVEAVSKGVVKSRLTEFLEKSKNVYLAKIDDESLKETAVKKAIKNLGKPYNFEYFNNDGSTLYCSQLVYECYKYENGKTFFELDELKFKDPKSGEIIPFFIEYYKKLGVKMPLGEKGTHPATLSKNKKLHINKIK